MPVSSVRRPMSPRPVPRVAAAAVLGLLLAAALDAAAWARWQDAAAPASANAPDHLVVSEVLTGGASASDEFIELYNPTAGALPLEGLEVIYVSASGATVTRKAAWSAGAAEVPSGAHVLVANEAGLYAAVADLTYANGLAASGGSVALRIQGAASAIDAVGWGTAASTWLEGTPLPAPASGHAMERLPGGAAGSGQDTDQNSVDFVAREVPDPQNTLSPPIDIGAPTPSPTATPTPAAIATPPATPTPTPTPTPLPAPATPIAEARALPDGSVVTVEGVALTDGAFSDGGGYLVDAGAGIAILVADGSFPRGVVLRVTGTLDDRYHQRTLRTAAADVAILGEGTDPPASTVTTAAIGEAQEGQLVTTSGALVSGASTLSGGVAFDFDDGSGVVRLVVHAATGIDVAAWARGTRLELRGVVGQRDSGGTGAAGYRLQPRDPADVLAVAAPATPTPAPSITPPPSASGSTSPSPQVVSIATARAASANARLTVRGVVTLPSSLLGDGTAAIQDASGAIILRLGDEAGQVALGELVEVDGTRSTKSGMETLRVSAVPRRIGSQAQPEAARRSTGALGEADEARLVVVRGSVTGAPRRSSAENVYVDLDDGSGPIRIYLTPASAIDGGSFVEGAWVEVVGVLGQETTGRQPERGYRLWPRSAADVRVVAAVIGPGGPSAAAQAGDPPGPAAPARPAAGPDGLPGGTRPPTLEAPRLAVAAPTFAPPSRLLAATREPSSTEPVPGHVAILLTAAAALGGLGALAAASPGIVGRLRDAIGRPSGDAGDRPGGGPDDEATADPNRSPVEQAVARIVPLAAVAHGEPTRRERG